MRIYRPGFTKPMPKVTERFIRKGIQFIRFVDGRDHVKVGRPTQDGKRILLEHEHWHIAFKDNMCIRRDIKCFTDEKATRRLADTIQSLLNTQANNAPLDKELQKRIEALPVRIRDAFIKYNLLDQERSVAGCPLTELLEDFRQFLVNKERDAKYVKSTISQLRRIFDECGLRYWSDISDDKVKNQLDEWRDRGNGIGKRTYNGYLRAAKQFCNWAVKKKKVSTSPLKQIEKMDNEETDLRHPRRALTSDELRRLLEATAFAPERFGMTGPQRTILYRFTTETGLRASEVRSLKVSMFDFNELTITVGAAYSKHRLKDVLPLRKEMAAKLKSYFANKLPTARAFDIPDKPADMIKEDLADAKIPYCDDSGFYADFHSLRHTFITNLRNVPSRVAQSLARHQSSAMTDRYTHVHLNDERAALESLPDLSLPSSQQKKKTGTDELNVAGSNVTGVSVSKTCFSGGQKRTNTEMSGQKNPDSEQETHLSENNEGSFHTLNQRVTGSNPVSPIKKRGFSPQRMSSVCSLLEKDPDLKMLIERWPKVSVELRKAIVRMIE